MEYDWIQESDTVLAGPRKITALDRNIPLRGVTRLTSSERSKLAEAAKIYKELVHINIYWRSCEIHGNTQDAGTHLRPPNKGQAQKGE
jgi:hypothetical protein